MRGTLIYISYRLLSELIGRLPARVGYWLASRMGSLLYRVYPGLSRVVTHNTRHVLGANTDEDQVKAVARQTCRNIAKGHYDLFRLTQITDEEIRELVHIVGKEHMYAALARGQGVVVVSAHFGNVDIIGQLPMIYGIPVTAAAEHIQPERLFRYLLRIRQSHGLRLIPADEPLIGLFRALKRGEMIVLPCDRDFGDHSRFVDFFDSPARLPDGPVRVALRTGAAIVPAFAVRRPDDSFLLRIYPPLELPQTGNLEADVAAGMELVVAALERQIAEHPEQWLVASPVWPMD